jgi:hypothetical protein
MLGLFFLIIFRPLNFDLKNKSRLKYQIQNLSSKTFEVVILCLKATSITADFHIFASLILVGIIIFKA